MYLQWWPVPTQSILWREAWGEAKANAVLHILCLQGSNQGQAFHFNIIFKCLLDLLSTHLGVFSSECVYPISPSKNCIESFPKKMQRIRVLIQNWPMGQPRITRQFKIIYALCSIEMIELLSRYKIIVEGGGWLQGIIDQWEVYKT